MPLATMGIVGSAHVTAPPWLDPRIFWPETFATPAGMPPASGACVWVYEYDNYATDSSFRTLAAQYPGTGTTGRVFRMNRTASGVYQSVLLYSTDGAGENAGPDVFPSAPFTSGVFSLHAHARNQDTGDAQTWKNIGAGWVSVGTATGTPGAMYGGGTNPVRIGQLDNDGTWSSQWIGRLRFVECRTGMDPSAGTIIWRFDPAEHPPGSTDWTDPRGLRWIIRNPKAIIHNELPTETVAVMSKIAGASIRSATPPPTALRTVGDMDVSWFGSILPIGNQVMLSHYNSQNASRSWMLRLETAALRVYVSTLGTNDIPNTASATGFTNNGQYVGYRFTRRKSDGLTRMYISLTDPPSWTQIGSDEFLAAGLDLFDSGAAISISGHSLASFPYRGTFRRAEIRNGFDGAGSIVASPNMAAVPIGATTFADAQGNTWNIDPLIFLTTAQAY